jgi:hypothetical protein
LADGGGRTALWAAVITAIGGVLAALITGVVTLANAHSTPPQPPGSGSAQTSTSAPNAISFLTTNLPRAFPGMGDGCVDLTKNWNDVAVARCFNPATGVAVDYHLLVEPNLQPPSQNVVSARPNLLCGMTYMRTYTTNLGTYPWRQDSYNGPYEVDITGQQGAPVATVSNYEVTADKNFVCKR